MDWDIDDKTMAELGGERLIITLDVAELVPGTYIYLDTDDEIIMRGAILDAEDTERGIPLALPDFGGEFDDDDDDDEEDTDPNVCTIVGPLLVPRTPGPARATTIKGSPIQPRRPALALDQILNEIDDDENGGYTMIGPPMALRRPAPRGR